MLLYLSLSGIFLSVILLSFNAGKLRSTYYLGAFFFFISLHGVNQYALLHSKSVFLVSIFSTNFTFLYYLIGPVLYWYIRGVLTDNSRLRKTDLLHLIPSLVYLTASLPYILSSYAFKVQIATAIVKDVSFVGTYKFTVLSEIFSISSVFLSRPILILAYSLWSIALFISYLIRKENKLVFSNQSFMTKWLSFFLAFQFILIATYLISTFKTFIEHSDVFFTLNLLQIIAAAGMTGLFISPFMFPGILYGLPHVPEPVINVQVEEIMDLPSEEGKKSTPNLEAEYLLAIQQKADSSMREFQTFLKSDLNLNRFADIIELPAHHLAYYFREVKKQSFNDYCNECRIEYAKSLILDGKTGDLTLEAVGILSGFTNRSTFFRAFKKVEDISPGAFLVKMNQASLPA
ncbi:MAG: helix-turn-helix domain-containing protein [Bacteroidales bacterium]